MGAGKHLDLRPENFYSGIHILWESGRTLLQPVAGVIDDSF